MSDDPLEQLAEAARERSKPIPYAKRMGSNRPGLVRRYRESCGRRSFILQIILLAWTLAIGGFVAAVMLTARFGQPMLSDLGSGQLPPGFDSPLTAGEFSSTLARQRRVNSAAGSSVCLGVGWLVIALPLGIAAVVTLEAKRD
jgi:hypothetical protein